MTEARNVQGMPPLQFEEEEFNEFWVTEFNDDLAIRFQRKVFDSITKDPKKPFIIKINSPGGEVHALMSMLDTMLAAKQSVGEGFGFITVASGKAFSAAALLLSAGDVRLATNNTSIMIHQVVGGSWGSHPENQIEFAEIARLNQQILTILKQNCKLKKSTEDLERLLKHNLYLTPAQARDYGLIDAIGYPVIREYRMYDVELVGVTANVESRRADKKATKTKSKSRTVRKASKQPPSRGENTKRGTQEAGTGTSTITS